MKISKFQDFVKKRRMELSELHKEIIHEGYDLSLQTLYDIRKGNVKTPCTLTQRAIQAGLIRWDHEWRDSRDADEINAIFE